MKRPPAVAVHGLAQACAVIGSGLDATLISGPGAGWYAGAAWWVAVMQAARDACGAAPAVDMLDCADAPGAAVSALRLGQRLVILDAACPAFPRVAAMARALGAEVLATRPPCLDLSEAGAERRLAAWLNAGEGDSTPGLR